ncbi:MULTISPECIES: DUF7471 family protein [unclassified Haloparvum]|uniref:DUF7471 family protein n=1 Tax=Haloparvum sp. PAK95 TaxID=3418962 RepID=UPI003D2EAFDE
MIDQHYLIATLVIAGLGSAALVALASVAVLRRRSWSHSFVAIALGALLTRSLLGSMIVGGHISHGTHHLLEHLLDAFITGLLFAAIYTARTVEQEPPLDEDQLEDT